MTKFGQLVTATVIIALLGAGAYWFLKGGKTGNSADLPDFNFAMNLQNAVNAASGSGGAEPQGTANYENLYWGFSFNYPDGFQVSEIDEENGGFTVLAEGAGEKKTFQIFIADFDEAGPITPERIKKDLPDKKIEQPQRISFAGADALAFISPDDQGNMIEVWFIQGGALYQVRAYFEFTEGLSKILATWKFL